jgi:hypothetical protein
MFNQSPQERSREMLKYWKDWDDGPQPAVRMREVSRLVYRTA